MKTTLELPDDLARRIKIRAAERNQKLKVVIAQLLELGLASARKSEPRCGPPRPVKLRKQGPLLIYDIEAAIAAGHD